MFDTKLSVVKTKPGLLVEDLYTSFKERLRSESLWGRFINLFRR